MTDEASTSGSDFVHRVVRVIASITLTYAAVLLLQYAVYLMAYGLLWSYGEYRVLNRAIHLSTVGLNLLLLCAALAMLRWKAWSRPAMMWWAGLSIVVSFASNMRYVVEAVQELSRAATQPYRPHIWQTLVGQMFWWMQYSILPLLIWLVLRQPEAAKLFDRTTAGGGFDVVPKTRVVPMLQDGGDAHTR